jgi:hypothetical protein
MAAQRAKLSGVNPARSVPRDLRNHHRNHRTATMQAAIGFDLKLFEKLIGDARGYAADLKASDFAPVFELVLRHHSQRIDIVPARGRSLQCLRQ